MKREKPSFYHLLALIVKIIVGILTGGWILIMVFLMFLSMNDPSKRELSQSPPLELRFVDETTSEVYLRNRTDSVLFLMVTVSRSSLQMDTVWWGINVAPEAVGRAVAAVAPYLTLGKIVYPLTAPILLQDSGDTLVADKPIDLPATGQVGKHKLFYPHRNLPLWKERVRQFKPAFEPTMIIQPFSGQPDSVVIIVRVTSYGTFLLAREEKRITKTVELEDVNANGRKDTLIDEQTTFSALLPKVRWTDSLHHSRKLYITLADIKKARTTQAIHDSAEYNKLTYYLDYQ
ncbi:hypothetical protein [Hymenobacter sp.]|jgi:hypothetical protein|uniref:hypothetical protein n=1 Tax=Hymenobacter sp. TaxID=1898978 RepID=UPI002ED974FA